MELSERRTHIRANLSIEPISHGQIYTFQIAVPESEKENISTEQRLLIEESLTQHKSNLIPLIVRRTEAYSEEEEYEVVYGADWCLVAKELDIDKLWVWVFDMTDNQAAAAKKEMQQLVGFPGSIPVVLPIPEDTLNKKIEQVTASIKKPQETESQQVATDDKLVQQFTKAVKTIIEEVLSKQAEGFRTIIEEVLSKQKQKDESNKQTQPDYNSNKKEELKNLAKQRGIKVTSSMTKDAIIKALEQADKR